MAGMPAESVDAVVTDPPYGLEFMGREWDSFGGERQAGSRGGNGDRGLLPGYGRGGTPQDRVAFARRSSGAFQAFTETWAREALRVLKPGGHLLAFGGTRTYHRLTCAIEDAGFEIRDCLVYLYGAGFPKSLSPYRSMLSRQCPSNEHARRAVRLSEWHPAEWPEARAPTALALAEMLPEGELALLIRTGEVAGSFAGTAMPSSALKVVGISLNTESSWSECSDVVFDGTSTSITETVTALTTDPRTWRCWTSLPTPPTTLHPGSRPDGCGCDAWRVAEGSTDGELRWSATPARIAPGPATGGRLKPTEPLGTALKPSHEPVVVARKPLRERTVAAQVLATGTGGLNIDACRIAHASDADRAESEGKNQHARYANPGSNRDSYSGQMPPRTTYDGAAGRWPANVALDGEAARLLDSEVGGLPGGTPRYAHGDKPLYGSKLANIAHDGFGDQGGGPSRFFYTAKASTGERDGATHPTVKPLDLMRWLVRLVTPPGGVVLEPFAGSGTTLLAAKAEGFGCIGIERDPAYAAMAAERYRRRWIPAEAEWKAADEDDQLSLLGGAE
jgi:DNA modification methylase